MPDPKARGDLDPILRAMYPEDPRNVARRAATEAARQRQRDEHLAARLDAAAEAATARDREHHRANRPRHSIHRM